MNVNRKSYLKNKIGYYILVSLMALSYICFLPKQFGVTCFAKEVNNQNVYLSVEAFTIGQGFVVEPVVIQDGAGMRVDEVLYQVFGDRIPKPKAGYYLNKISNADQGSVNIPLEIANMSNYGKFKAPSNDEHDENMYYPDLGEFSYSPMAGWMYSVNGVFPSESMDNYVLVAGDVVRVQFTIHGYGADLGGFWDGNDDGNDDEKVNTITPLAVANKDELMKQLAIINENKDAWMCMPVAKETYRVAEEIAKDLMADQENVDRIVSSFPQKLCVSANDISFTKQEVYMLEGKTETLNISYNPIYTTEKNVKYKGYDEEVLGISEDGVVTAKKMGSTSVIAETENGKYATISINVLSLEKAVQIIVDAAQDLSEITKPSSENMAQLKKAQLLLQILTKDEKEQIGDKLLEAETTLVKIQDRFENANKDEEQQKNPSKNEQSDNNSSKNDSDLQKKEQESQVVNQNNLQTGDSNSKIEKDVTKKNESEKEVKIAKTKFTSVTLTKKKQVQLKWKKNSGIDGVIIYRSTNKKGVYKKIKKITSNKTVRYLDKKVKRNKTYYYKICAYKKVGKKIRYGAMSTVKKVRVR